MFAECIPFWNLATCVIQKYHLCFQDNDGTTTTMCLFDNGGQPIHVVKLDNTHMSDNDVKEIGGVNVADIIVVDASDDEGDCGRSPLGQKIMSHTLPTAPPRMDHTNDVIELPEGDEENESTNSKLSASGVEDDDDVVFMDPPPTCPETNVQSSAMIGIFENKIVC